MLAFLPFRLKTLTERAVEVCRLTAGGWPCLRFGSGCARVGRAALQVRHLLRGVWANASPCKQRVSQQSPSVLRDSPHTLESCWSLTQYPSGSSGAHRGIQTSLTCSPCLGFPQPVTDQGAGPLPSPTSCVRPVCVALASCLADVRTPMHLPLTECM